LKKNNEIKNHFEKLKEDYDKVEKNNNYHSGEKKKKRKETIIKMKK